MALMSEYYIDYGIVNNIRSMDIRSNGVDA